MRLKQAINLVGLHLTRIVSCTDWDRELLTQMTEVYSSSGNANKALNDVTYETFKADEGEEYSYLWINLQS